MHEHRCLVGQLAVDIRNLNAIFVFYICVSLEIASGMGKHRDFFFLKYFDFLTKK